MKDNSQKLSIFDLAIREDIGDGDITTQSLFKEKKIACACVYAKENFILAGGDVFKRFWNYVDKNIKIKQYKKDGDHVKYNSILFTLEGDVSSLLTYERIGLNFLSHLSAIATKTRKFSDKIKNYKTKILDTRKTTPGMRMMEKEAVRIGGGHNHRMGLFDRFLIKDNHIKAYGNIKEAIENIKKKSKDKIIEVEVRNFNELNNALLNPPDIIMLDNMKTHEVKKAARLINKKCKIEVSGGINLNNILAYAKCGVDYISIGELTHSIKSCDVSMKIVNSG